MAKVFLLIATNFHCINFSLMIQKHFLCGFCLGTHSCTLLLEVFTAQYKYLLQCQTLILNEVKLFCNHVMFGRLHINCAGFMCVTLLYYFCVAHFIYTHYMLCILHYTVHWT